MTVAFWSNVRGSSCVTSNLACMSILSILDSSREEKTILLENHHHITNLGNAFISHYSKQWVREKKTYQTETGLAKLFYLLDREDIPEREKFYHLMEDFLGEKLFYLSAEGISNRDLFEYQFERDYQKIIRYLEQMSDYVMIDTASASLPSSRRILQQADLIVVNLCQNRQMLEHFFENYSEIRKKAFYILGNSDSQSEWCKQMVMKRFRIPYENVGVIPHNVQFADAMSDGKVISFLQGIQNCVPQNINHDFYVQTKETALLLKKRLDQLRDQ